MGSVELVQRRMDRLLSSPRGVPSSHPTGSDLFNRRRRSRTVLHQSSLARRTPSPPRGRHLFDREVLPRHDAPVLRVRRHQPAFGPFLLLGFRKRRRPERWLEGRRVGGAQHVWRAVVVRPPTWRRRRTPRPSRVRPPSSSGRSMVTDRASAATSINGSSPDRSTSHPSTTAPVPTASAFPTPFPLPPLPQHPTPRRRGSGSRSSCSRNPARRNSTPRFRAPASRSLPPPCSKPCCASRSDWCYRYRGFCGKRPSSTFENA